MQGEEWRLHGLGFWLLATIGMAFPSSGVSLLWAAVNGGAFDPMVDLSVMFLPMSVYQNNKDVKGWVLWIDSSLML